VRQFFRGVPRPLSAAPRRIIVGRGRRLRGTTAREVAGALSCLHPATDRVAAVVRAPPSGPPRGASLGAPVPPGAGRPHRRRARRRPRRTRPRSGPLTRTCPPPPPTV